ncbi:Uncharacterised protein [Mycobacteroides abscessus subsp. abscessus]|nr:Uncharacterised protein [Mycobacteroides abscessus subsp. abscessus]
MPPSLRNWFGLTWVWVPAPPKLYVAVISPVALSPTILMLSIANFSTVVDSRRICSTPVV